MLAKLFAFAVRGKIQVCSAFTCITCIRQEQLKIKQEFQFCLFSKAFFIWIDLRKIYSRFIVKIYNYLSAFNFRNVELVYYRFFKLINSINRIFKKID